MLGISLICEYSFVSLWTLLPAENALNVMVFGTKRMESLATIMRTVWYFQGIQWALNTRCVLLVVAESWKFGWRVVVRWCLFLLHKRIPCLQRCVFLDPFPANIGELISTEINGNRQLYVRRNCSVLMISSTPFARHMLAFVCKYFVDQITRPNWILCGSKEGISRYCIAQWNRVSWPHRTGVCGLLRCTTSLAC